MTASSRRESGEIRRQATVSQKSSVTLEDVARHAGVSLATASRVLNARERTVGDAYRERVLAAAAELGYRPNAYAQAMALGSSRVVGLIVHDIADPYFSTIAGGVAEAADERGLVVMLSSTGRSFEKELEYVGILHAHRARALVVVGTRITDREQTALLAKEIQSFRSAGGRAVCVSQSRLGIHTVQPQNRSGARDLARRLTALGHQRFAVLAGPPEFVTAHDRLAGFQAGLREAGLGEDAITVVHSAFNRDGGFKSARTLLDQGLKVSCVFAVSDVMAMGAMTAFREAGVRVPGDVSLAGFDDIETLRDVNPSLTTVRLPLKRMGMRALELALDSGPEDSPKVVRVGGKVILRESTRRVG